MAKRKQQGRSGKRAKPANRPEPGVIELPLGKLLLGAGLLLLGLGLSFWLYRGRAPAGPDLPEANLADAQSAVLQAVAAARASVIAQPESAAAWGELGMVYDAHGYGEEGLQCYAEAEKHAPEDFRWPYLAGLLLRDKDARAAADALERAIEGGARFPAAWWNLGNVQLDLGDLAGASDSMSRAAALAPNSPETATGLGRVALLEGDTDAAIERFQAALALDPNSSEAHGFLAQAYGRVGRDADADRHARLADYYDQGEDRSMADPVLTEMISKGVSTRWLTRRARALHEEGKIGEAAALFAQALEAAPNDPAALIGLGVSLQAGGETARARDYYRKALQIEADNVEALSNLGLSLAQLGDPDGAELQYRRALEIQPGHVATRLNLGLLELDRGNAAEAVTLAEAVLVDRPADLRALDLLARALAASGDLDAADEAWRHLTDLEPLSEPAWTAWADMLMRGGRHADALARLREAGLLLPDSALLAGMLSWELSTAPEASLRDGRAALEIAEGLQSRIPGPQALDILAAARAELGDFDAAIAAAEEALAAAEAAGANVAAGEISARIEGYRAGRAYRQTTVKEPEVKEATGQDAAPASEPEDGP
jgi:tetratricopeptide (TPR) repeat protein